MLRTLTSLLLLLPLFAVAQMPDGSAVRYGNEWVDPDRDYLRLEVAEDGALCGNSVEAILAASAEDGRSAW